MHSETKKLKKLFTFNYIFRIFLMLILIYIPINYLKLRHKEEIKLEIINLEQTTKSNETIKGLAIKKYIEYQCTNYLCGGWSDRLDGIMSAFALALIQNRNFLIRITQPCLINNLLEPNSIKWNETIQYSNMSRHHINAIDNFQIHSIMKTNDFDTYLSQYDFISIQNNQDWLKSLSENKNLEKKIKQLNYEPNRFRAFYLFKDWYAKLFKLRPNLEKKYENFLKAAKSTKITKLICAQIRIGGNRNNHASDHQFNEKTVTKLVWSFIKKQIIIESNLTDYKLFITTDDEDVQKEAFDEFGSDKVVTNDGEILHIDKDAHDLNDCSRIEKTILDFHSLQNCDFGLVSSGFGKMGLWNRVDPFRNLFIINRNGVDPILNTTESITAHFNII